MDNYKIYFAEEGQPGLTMDKAQRLCVWAEKMMMDAQAAISSVNFVGEKEVTMNQEELVTVIGDTQISFDKEIKDMIALTSLMSWLHEAIKAKTDLSNKVNSMTVEEWARENGIELPEFKGGPMRRRRRITDPEEDYTINIMRRWEPEKVARFYRLQNTCAILHKLVGQDAPYEAAIKRLLEITKKPREKSWHGDKLYVTEFTPSVDVDAAIKQYQIYQMQHSQAQSELNAMKYELEQEVKRCASKEADEKKIEYDAYLKETEELDAQFVAQKAQEIEKVRQIKIRIPENLMDIFHAVRSMGQEPIDVD